MSPAWVSPDTVRSKKRVSSPGLLSPIVTSPQVPPTRNVDALSLLGYTLGTSSEGPKNYYLDVAYTGKQVSAIIGLITEPWQACAF